MNDLRAMFLAGMDTARIAKAMRLPEARVLQSIQRDRDRERGSTAYHGEWPAPCRPYPHSLIALARITGEFRSRVRK